MAGCHVQSPRSKGQSRLPVPEEERCVLGKAVLKRHKVSQKMEAIEQQEVGCDTLRNNQSVREVSRGTARRNQKSKG